MEREEWCVYVGRKNGSSAEHKSKTATAGACRVSVQMRGLSAALVLHPKHNSFTTSKRHQRRRRKFVLVRIPKI